MSESHRTDDLEVPITFADTQLVADTRGQVHLHPDRYHRLLLSHRKLAAIRAYVDKMPDAPTSEHQHKLRELLK